MIILCDLSRATSYRLSHSHLIQYLNISKCRWQVLENVVKQHEFDFCYFWVKQGPVYDPNVTKKHAKTMTARKLHYCALFWSRVTELPVWFRLSVADLTQILCNISLPPLPPLPPPLPPSGSMLQPSRDLSHNWCVSRFNREELGEELGRKGRISYLKGLLHLLMAWALMMFLWDNTAYLCVCVACVCVLQENITNIPSETKGAVHFMVTSCFWYDISYS